MDLLFSENAQLHFTTRVEKISVTPAKNDLSRGLVVKGNTKHPFGKDERDETQSSYQCFQRTSEGWDRAMQKYLHPREAAHPASGAQAEGDDPDSG